MIEVIDWDKVTPAPWFPGVNSRGEPNVFAGDGIDVTPAFVERGTGRPMSGDDAAAIAALRNMLHVLVTRRWGVKATRSGNGWYVVDRNGTPVLSGEEPLDVVLKADQAIPPSALPPAESPAS